MLKKLLNIENFEPIDVIVPVLLLFLIYYVIQIIKDVKAAKWPSVTGRIRYSGQDTYDYLTNDGMESGNRKEVIYEYTVDGIEYESKNVSFGSLFFGKNHEDYITNMNILVHFNPSKPHISLLNPGFKFYHLANLFILITFNILVALFLIEDAIPFIKQLSST